MKVKYISDIVYDPINDGAKEYMLPQCPHCDAYPTYNEDNCPFCGKKIEYED